MNLKREREKIIIEIYGEEKQMLEFRVALNLKKSTSKHLRSPDSVADAVLGFLVREEAKRDIKIFFPLFIFKALHLRRVWLDNTACKLTTTCAQHWSKVRNFKIFQ